MGEVALAWVIAQPGIASVLAGARSPEQARQNALAGDLSLDPPVVEAIAAATDAVKRILGPNADMWQTESRLR